MPTVSVLDSSGTAVPGTLTRRSYYWVFTPDMPWVVGATYSVTLSSSDQTVGAPSQTTMITIIDADTSAWPTLSASPTIMSVQQQSPSLCCSSFPTLTSGTCFSSGTITSAMVDAMVTTSTLQPALGQFLFLVRTAPSEAATDASAFGPSATSTSLIYMQSASEYCFDVDALNINTGEIHRYDTLSTRCVPNGSLPTLLETKLDLAALGNLDAVRCQVPPAGFEDAWCAQNSDPCEANRKASNCQSYGYVCHGEPLPVQQSTTTTIMNGAGGTGAIYYYDDTVAPNEDNSSGCSVALGHTQEPSTLLVLAGVLFAWRAQKRTRTRVTAARRAASDRTRSAR